MRKYWKHLAVPFLTAVFLASSAVAAAEEMDIPEAILEMGEDISLEDIYNNDFGISPEMFAQPQEQTPDMLSQDDGKGDVIAIDDYGISIVAGDYVLIKQDESDFVYIFTMGEFIPFVMVKMYETDWDYLPEGFFDMYNEVMARDYADLSVVGSPSSVTLSGRTFYRTQYEYTISGYTTKDVRLFTQFNRRTYMFVSKEIISRNDVLPENYLEQIAASMTPLAGGYDDYDKHVDKTRSVTGIGTSLGSMGGYDTEPQSTPQDNSPQGGPASGP